MPIDPTDHPADHIDHAQAMLGFLSLVIGDGVGHLNLEEQDRAGLCYILSATLKITLNRH